MKREFSEFKAFVKGKDISVIGIGVSNRPLIKMLVSLGAKVTACDKATNIGEVYEELCELGVKLKLGEDYLEDILNSEVIFRTPSMLPSNVYLQKAIEKGIYVTSEIAEFIKYCPCKLYGITGSDGKTTTTSLIGEMLKSQGYRVHVGGNIGTPLFNEIENMDKSDYAVIELSSFQLMDINISPSVAVITNLSPNHLDIHGDMEEYIEAKRRIFSNQGAGDVVVLNKDNSITNSMIKEVTGKLRVFSSKDNDAFSYLDKDTLICNGNKVCEVNEVILPGMHNIENLLTAFSAVYDDVSIENMRKVAMSFKGVEHRMEFVREVNGIRFYNGSIASSPTRTIADIKAFNKKVILIAGGYDKKIPFDELAAEGVDRIKILVLMGNTKEKIRSAFEYVMKSKNSTLKIIEASSFEDAVAKAYENAERGDIITLSPACASFDMFKNFEERGRVFKQIVHGIN